jgi:hypothetical protein
MDPAEIKRRLIRSASTRGERYVGNRERSTAPRPITLPAMPWDAAKEEDGE